MIKINPDVISMLIKALITIFQVVEQLVTNIRNEVNNG